MKIELSNQEITDILAQHLVNKRLLQTGECHAIYRISDGKLVAQLENVDEA